MNTGRGAGPKIREWVRRYLPSEIAGTVGELGGAAIAYLATGSLAAAAITATIGAAAGYYCTAYFATLRWSYRQETARRGVSRIAIANLLALRSIAVEFGPAELVDSVAVRPIAFYAGPLIFDSVAVGWIFAKFVADVAFYTCAIFSYERFAKFLVKRVPAVMEVNDGSEATSAAA